MTTKIATTRWQKKKHITELIGKIFKDQFAQQKKNMSNLFSGIFSLTKQQIEESSKISNRSEKKHRIHREPTGRKSGQCSK